MSLQVRNIVISVVFIVIGSITILFPPQKPVMSAKIDMAGLVPEQFSNWKSHTYDTSEYSDQWQSINQLLVRTYYLESERKRVDLYLEYSSDMRRAFSFHFPEDCYRAGGNEVVFLKPFAGTLPDGREHRAKTVFIKGLPGKREESDKVVVYWLVLEGKPYSDTFGVKVDQMVAGLFTKAREGFLVRLDVSGTLAPDAAMQRVDEETLKRFISDLFNTLDASQRDLLFGKK